MKRFAQILKEHGIAQVTGDRYAGETFRSDFQDERIAYKTCAVSASELYEAFEPRLNAGEIELPDVQKLTEQLLTLVIRGGKIDHQPGDHDDFANSAAGALWLVSAHAPMIISDAVLARAHRPGRYDSMRIFAPSAPQYDTLSTPSIQTGCGHSPDVVWDATGPHSISYSDLHDMHLKGRTRQ